MPCLPLGATISIISRTHVVLINERLRPFGLSAGQFPVLISLIKRQDVMQDTLARHLHIDKGAVARTVTKLVDAGYVRRTTDPANRRTVRLFLTQKGEAIAPAILRIDREWEETACSCLSPEDQAAFSRLTGAVARTCLATLATLEAD
jgi:Transcriptional regulators